MQVVDNGIVRLVYTGGDEIPDHESPVVVSQDTSEDWTTRETDERLELTTDELRVEVDRQTGATARLHVSSANLPRVANPSRPSRRRTFHPGRRRRRRLATRTWEAGGARCGSPTRSTCSPTSSTTAGRSTPRRSGRTTRSRCTSTGTTPSGPPPTARTTSRTSPPGRLERQRHGTQRHRRRVRLGRDGPGVSTGGHTALVGARAQPDHRGGSRRRLRLSRQRRRRRARRQVELIQRTGRLLGEPRRVRDRRTRGVTPVRGSPGRTVLPVGQPVCPPPARDGT